MTAVREAIVLAVLARKGHFEVSELARDLRALHVRGAALPTVYRVMPFLLEAGLIEPTLLSGTAHRFEVAFERERHDHLICTRCDKVVEFGFEAFDALEREVARRFGFHLTGRVHELVGTCPECSASGGPQRKLAGQERRPRRRRSLRRIDPTHPSGRSR